MGYVQRTASCQTFAFELEISGLSWKFLFTCEVVRVVLKNLFRRKIFATEGDGLEIRWAMPARVRIVLRKPCTSRVFFLPLSLPPSPSLSPSLFCTKTGQKNRAKSTKRGRGEGGTACTGRVHRRGPASEMRPHRERSTEEDPRLPKKSR